MKIVDWTVLNSDERKMVLTRPEGALAAEHEVRVKEVIARVRAQGDLAVLEMTKTWDKATLKALRVSSQETEEAQGSVSGDFVNALKLAAQNIEKFHLEQLPKSLKIETTPGVVCEKRYLPIENVGLYVPGGTAPLVSTVLMLGIPAKVAGCPRRVLATPPRPDGSIDPHILFAASLCGIDEIYKMGGAQAIAALAYGTESVKKTDKIFGPGNSWVTAAKMQVAQDPGGAVCDMPAGPSEVLVICDKGASPVLVAADLLSQAEHGIDSQVIVISDDADILGATIAEVQKQVECLPRREIALKALGQSRALLVNSIEEALEVSNQYAPEHLILQVKDPQQAILKVKNAGSVFLGPWSPEAVGDYASGTNHVLPTAGYARSVSGLGVESFMKAMTVQELTPNGLRRLGPSVEILAETETLRGHRQAVSLRLQALEGEK